MPFEYRQPSSGEKGSYRQRSRQGRRRPQAVPGRRRENEPKPHAVPKDQAKGK